MKDNETPILHPCTWMKKDKFFYIDAATPYLVLYTNAYRGNLMDDPHGELGKFSPPPNFINPQEWTSIMHQTAGYACHSYFIHAKFLKPKKTIYPLFEELTKRFNDSCICRVANLNTANDYEAILKKYKLTANNSYQYLEEGFYPIDIECLKKLTNEKFPTDLQELLLKSKKEKSLWNFLNYVDFNLAILGPNCD